MCFGCGTQINDQYILRVAPDLEWHAKCLKCFECGCYLDENCTCFVRNGKTYCKLDYVRLFSKKCFKCKLGFNKNDLVMRANNRIYHVDCFRCCMCNRHLSTGDEFALKEDGLLCKYDNEIYEKTTSTNNQTLPLNTNINLSNSLTTVNNNNSNNSSILQTTSCQNITNLQSTNTYTNLNQNTKPTILKCDDVNNNNNDYEDNQNCLIDSSNGYNPNPAQTTLTNLNNYNQSQRMMQPQPQLQTPQPQQTPFGLNGSSQSIGNKNGSTGSTSASSSSSGSSGSSSRSNILHGGSGGGGGHHRKDKTTRVRTVLNEKQLHTLRTCYGANPRPDALMKEQLVEMTGLSPRVIRVWFQNKRCKDKKKTILIKQMQEQQKVN